MDNTLTPVAPGSIWRHYNGNLYTVLFIANHASTNPKYPKHVVHQGLNGNVWTRPLDDWHRSHKHEPSVSWAEALTLKSKEKDS